MIQYCNTNIIHENTSIVKAIEAFHMSYLKDTVRLEIYYAYFSLNAAN